MPRFFFICTFDLKRNAQDRAHSRVNVEKCPKWLNDSVHVLCRAIDHYLTAIWKYRFEKSSRKMGKKALRKNRVLHLLCAHVFISASSDSSLLFCMLIHASTRPRGRQSKKQKYELDTQIQIYRFERAKNKKCSQQQQHNR